MYLLLQKEKKHFTYIFTTKLLYPLENVDDDRSKLLTVIDEGYRYGFLYTVTALLLELLNIDVPMTFVQTIES